MKSQTGVQANQVKTQDVGKTEQVIGPDPRGPKKCLHCHQPFLAGEVWSRVTSPKDPEFGSYVIGIHEACRGSSS